MIADNIEVNRGIIFKFNPTRKEKKLIHYNFKISRNHYNNLVFSFYSIEKKFISDYNIFGQKALYMHPNYSVLKFNLIDCISCKNYIEYNPLNKYNKKLSPLFDKDNNLDVVKNSFIPNNIQKESKQHTYKEKFIQWKICFDFFLGHRLLRTSTYSTDMTQKLGDNKKFVSANSLLREFANFISALDKFVKDCITYTPNKPSRPRPRKYDDTEQSYSERLDSMYKKAGKVDRQQQIYDISNGLVKTTKANKFGLPRNHKLRFFKHSLSKELDRKGIHHETFLKFTDRYTIKWNKMTNDYYLILGYSKLTQKEINGVNKENIIGIDISFSKDYIGYISNGETIDRYSDEKQVKKTNKYIRRGKILQRRVNRKRGQQKQKGGVEEPTGYYKRVQDLKKIFMNIEKYNSVDIFITACEDVIGQMIEGKFKYYDVFKQKLVEKTKMNYLVHFYEKFHNKKLKSKRCYNEAKKIATSNSYIRLRKKEASIKKKEKNIKSDLVHNISHNIANNDKINGVVMEGLNFSDMKKSKFSSKAIQKFAPSIFMQTLQYKLEERGKCFIKIDKFEASTQCCSCCGHTLTGDERLTLKDRKWTCPKCGTEHHRDFNSSVVIYEKGTCEIKEIKNKKTGKVEYISDKYGKLKNNYFFDQVVKKNLHLTQ